MRFREDVIDIVLKNGIGVELGVAEGEFSERILKKNHLDHLFSIDMWKGDRGHDDNQYKNTVKRLLPYKKNNTIMKMKFDDALDLFDDHSLDFIYFDGYAHNAQENAKTLDSWFKKLKPFGVFAGDDYHDHFRENVTVIDLFKDKHNLLLNIIPCHEPKSVWSEYPTWWAINVPQIDVTNKTVAIVGNSLSQFDKDKGKEIDDHDIVIRLNRCTSLFELGRHAKSHGNKTDIWCTWRVDEYESFMIDMPTHTMQMAFWLGSNIHKKILCYTLAEFKRLQKIYDSHEIPSTGLMTLHWISEKNPKSVDVYGFDWKETPTWTDIQRTRDGIHDFTKEKQMCIDYFKNIKGYKFH